MVYSRIYSHDEISTMVLKFLGNSCLHHPEIVFYKNDGLEVYDLYDVSIAESLPSKDTILSIIQDSVPITCLAAIDEADEHRLMLATIDKSVLLKSYDTDYDMTALQIWQAIQP